MQFPIEHDPGHTQNEIESFEITDTRPRSREAEFASETIAQPYVDN